MTAAGPGPKMILDQVEAAERIVADSVQQMQAVAQQLQGRGAASLTAMRAPAGHDRLDRLGDEREDGLHDPRRGLRRRR